MTTVYQDEIDCTLELLQDLGQSIVVRRSGGTSNTYDETDFGSLSASGSTFTFGSGDLTTVVAVGDTVEFSLLSNFNNRGPWVVTDVTATTVEIDGSLETSSDSEWEMEVTSNATTDAAGNGVSLPPKSATGQQFDQDFRDGTLHISEAQDVIIAAKNLSLTPQPGDKVQFGSTSWSDGAETWDIYGIGAVQPDGTSIVHMGVVYRG